MHALARLAGLLAALPSAAGSASENLRGRALADVRAPATEEAEVLDASTPRQLAITLQVTMPDNQPMDTGTFGAVLTEHLHQVPDFSNVGVSVEPITELNPTAVEQTPAPATPPPTPAATPPPTPVATPPPTPVATPPPTPVSTPPPTPEATTVAETTQPPATTTQAPTAAPTTTAGRTAEPTPEPTAEPTPAPTPAHHDVGTASVVHDLQPDCSILVTGIDYNGVMDNSELQQEIKGAAQESVAMEAAETGMQAKDVVITLKAGSLLIEAAVERMPTGMTHTHFSHRLALSSTLPKSIEARLQDIRAISQVQTGPIKAELANGAGGGFLDLGTAWVWIGVAVVGQLLCCIALCGNRIRAMNKDMQDRRGFERFDGERSPKSSASSSISLRDLKLHAIVVPGSGLSMQGLPTPWVQERLKKAKELYEECQYSGGEGKPHIITLSGGRPQGDASARDTGRSMASEAEANAAYLVDHLRSPREHVFEETLSHDLISNAYFLRTMNTDVMAFKDLAIITNEFQLERTQAIFEKVFELQPIPPGLQDGYNLHFIKVDDVGLDRETLKIREEEEAKALEAFEKVSADWADLHDVHVYIFKSSEDEDEDAMARDKPRPQGAPPGPPDSTISQPASRPLASRETKTMPKKDESPANDDNAGDDDSSDSDSS